MRYTIRVTGKARKELAKLPASVRQRVLAVIDALADDPHPIGSKRLEDHDSYRVRVGRYRVLYTVDDAARVVEVWRVRHRKDVYRDL